MDMTKITFCKGAFITGADCPQKNTCERFVRFNPNDKLQKTFSGIFPHEDFTCGYHWKLNDTECYAGNPTC
jgi:Zn ribbon nucleic-acid-binding protein